MSTIAPQSAQHPMTIGALAALEMGQRLMLSTFKHVPDDKLDWSPVPTAKSALRIAAHCAVANYGLSAVLEGKPMEASNFKELEAAMDPEELKITTREQAVNAIEASTNVARQAIAGVDPNTFENLVGKGDLQGPKTFYMNLIGLHMSMHSAQIDYLQTCWGDREPHFGG